MLKYFYKERPEIVFLMASILLFVLVLFVTQARADDRDRPNQSINEYTDFDAASVDDGDFFKMYDTSANEWKKTSLDGWAEVATVFDSVSSNAAELNLLDGATFTAAELNKIADDSARAVTHEGTASLTCAANGTGFVNYISAASADVTLTLPEATGSNCEYVFFFNALPDNTAIIQVATDDSINGILTMAQDGGDTYIAFETASDTDELTFTSTTQGAAVVGTGITLIDGATDAFYIKDSNLAGTGTEATPGATGQRS